ncbi:CPBP family intramembrane glutamic endopeptidase [Tahibacter sp.]|uniref:CPBP family intramembrane glutamic endopeptidase n=1 Tax=Tahibacter sp. TaxID=2056211 RepID=UPI0028C4BD47|nr:CPBP family intramembrane glutamic endopeptidase [Tahibacter sp.]
MISTHADFPYYAGEPVQLQARQWLVVLGALALAFALLVWPHTRLAGPWGLLFPALLFCAVPLVALAAVAGRAWTALYRRVTLRDALWMLGIAVANLVVSMLVGWTLSAWHPTAPNPAFATLAASDISARVIAFAAMVPQLAGEELFTILPFLACLWLLHTRWAVPRKTAVIAAWILSAVPFALVHLPTYNWNVLQCLLVIGSARLVLSLAYLATRNLWVSTGAHILNDWALFGFGLLAQAARSA